MREPSCEETISMKRNFRKVEGRHKQIKVLKTKVICSQNRKTINPNILHIYLVIT